MKNKIDREEFDPLFLARKMDISWKITYQKRLLIKSDGLINKNVPSDNKVRIPALP
jgi:hypothetical protein